MIFPAVALFALVTLFVTPISSAPVYIPNSNTDVTEPHFSHQMFSKDSPTSFGHSPRHGISNILKRGRSESIGPFAHLDSPLLHTGAIGGVAESPLARVTVGDRPRLVRRKSVAAKIKSAFQKVGAGIKNAAKKVASGVKNVAQKVASGVKTAAKKVASGVKNVAQKVASGVKTAAKKVASGVKNAAQKVASGVKTAAKKVGNFVKTNGAKIAKFGLKVYATATKVAGRVASFIPGVGKPISKALSGVSKVANFASDKIHANLGSKLEKGISVMNKIQNPVGGVAGEVLDAVMKRDVNEEHLFERDLSELETRSFEDGEGLEARSFEGEEIEARSFDDAYELEARSFEDVPELEARSWYFDDEA